MALLSGQSEIIKLMGAVLILGACSFLGAGISRGYALRPVQLRALRSALQQLETEINYTATPLPDAMRRVACFGDPAVSTFFGVVGGKLEKDPACTATEAWSFSLEEFKHRSAMRKEDLAVLYSVGHNLGSSGPEEQLKKLQLVREQLGQLELSAEAERVKYERLWRTLGILSGMALVIMFY